jgi:hypothetical protein
VADNDDHAIVMFYHESVMLMSFTTKVNRDSSGAILKEMRELGKKYSNEFVPLVTGAYISFYVSAKYEYEALLQAIHDGQIRYHNESDQLSLDDYVALGVDESDGVDVSFYEEDFVPENDFIPFLDEVPKNPESIGCMGYDTEGRHLDDLREARRAYLAWQKEDKDGAKQRFEDDAEAHDLARYLSEKTMAAIS